MTWNLVEALTGLWTGDDWNNNGRGEEVVTVKTHYPQSNGIIVDFDEKIQRGFIMIRNPMKSIPSFFNHIYEMRNHLPVHSERAPLEEWIKWRNAYLDIEIAEYKKFIIYWMDRFTPENRLLITYEGLTDDLIGAEVTKGLSEFLGQADGVTTIDPSSVACIWRAVVKNEPPPQQAAQIKKLQSLALNQPQGTTVVQRQQEPQQQRQQLEQPTSNNAAILEQTLQSIQQKETPPRQDADLDQQLQEAQQKLQALQQQIQEKQIQETHAQEQVQEQVVINIEDEPAYPLEQQLLETQQQLQQLMQSQQQQPQQTPGLRRRLDPGHHNSQRTGPEVARPYTSDQLDKMMNMLLEVAERYHEIDVRLYHIMMGYYEQIRGERAKLSLDPKGLKPPGGFW